MILLWLSEIIPSNKEGFIPLSLISKSLEPLVVPSTSPKWFWCPVIGKWNLIPRHVSRLLSPLVQVIKFIMMLFGLCNAPSMFQCLMECVLQGLAWQIALTYLEDVLVHSPTFEEHLKHLPLVFDQFREPGLKLKPNKSHFGQSRANYLGQVITPDGLPQAMDQNEMPNCTLPKWESALVQQIYQNSTPGFCWCSGHRWQSQQRTRGYHSPDNNQSALCVPS